MNYDKTVKLQPTNPEEDAAAAAVESEDGGVDGAVPALTVTGPLVIDISPNLDVAEHYFLDNPTLLNKIASCLQGVDTNLSIDD